MEMSAISRMGVELQPLSRELLLQKYALGGEATPEEVLDRVAKGLVGNEMNPHEWEVAFREALDYCVLGGRINASSGIEETGTTWSNCFVQPVADSVFDADGGAPGIMEAARQAAQTMRLGGGVGYDFSVIRPKGAWIKRTRSHASGPISYMNIFDSMCSTVMSAGSRRGAQMGILRCDHPDIFDFIVCKRVQDLSTPYHLRPLRNFNLSVAITDRLMRSVLDNTSFELVHKAEPSPSQKASGASQRADGMWVYKTVNAKDLYDQIMRSNYDRGEPGVVFLDRINQDNNLRYCETIAATNPCGEQPLPAHGCCDLGHLLLPRFVENTAWEGVPTFNFEKLESVVPTLVRMLDNVLDLTPWPLPEQKKEALAKRRIGLGFTGLGDTLIMMGLKYSSSEGRTFAARIAETWCNAAYAASAELALEKGAFPMFDAEKYLEGVSIENEGTFASRLPERIKKQIRKYGIRNSHLLSLAPTGTGSLTFGNNCSSGCEPPFSFMEKRYVQQPDGTRKLENGLMNYAYLQFRQMEGEDAGLPEYFESAQSIDVSAHVEMLKTLAPFVDAAISKTVNIPKDFPFEAFRSVYFDAWAGGLKGLTTFRPNEEMGAVIIADTRDSKTPDLPTPTDDVDPDRRLRLHTLPHTVMTSLRWLDRPHMPDGNPSYTYMAENPQGDFAVMVGHHINGDVHPFEVWINGAEAPRGLGAVAKTLSADMRTFDRGWLQLKLESLSKCEGEEIEVALPPSGEIRRAPSVVSAFAQIVKYHCEKIEWLHGEGDASLVDAMMFRKEPHGDNKGTLSWTIEIKNPSTHDDLTMFVKELEMPDGSRRPYSVWIAGNYPKTFDGLCKLLSIDMRVIDPAWIGMKLRKLLSYKEPQGDFLARVPGSTRQASFPSTIAYMAQLLIYRFHLLGILDAQGEVASSNAFLDKGQLTLNETRNGETTELLHGTKCPECAVHAVVKYNGCDKCSNCGHTGSCG